ncbi:MAG: aminotransferase class III-fold pyridoxal phosphate-dependent enzyme, partial [Alicyclobacillus sp.]|nr:aminotransferase class III-fold pyridoxal phosphate-dependent enzyme [Alicyclobacillus sp.]
DLQAYADALERYGRELAAVLVEPIVGNFGIVPPRDPHYLKELIELAHRYGALVIFDEVITAFRFHYGAAAQLYQAEPDLYALGKAIGGGLPIGAYGGRRDVMEAVAPLGPVYQAGTMAGNPLSMRAGLACLAALRAPGVYEHMARLGERLATGIQAAAAAAGVAVTINRVGGAFTVYFSQHPVSNYADAQATDSHLFAVFFHALLRRGVYIAPSKYEAWFVSAAHSDADVDATLAAVAASMEEVAAAARQSERARTPAP